MRKIDAMLETAIEIEGLIRIIRDGEPGEETYQLLRRKIGELKPLPSPPHGGGSECFCGSDTAGDPTREPEDKRKTFSTRGPEKPEDQRDSIPEMAVEMEKEADVMMEEAEEVEMEAAKEAANQEVREDDIILSLEDDDAESNTSEFDETPKDYNDSSKSTEKKSEVRNLRAGFSLNDRFLYARELFDNNMKAFDSTLKSLEGVEDFGVIEDYFYNELDWDRENPIVKEFMEKLERN